MNRTAALLLPFALLTTACEELPLDQFMPQVRFQRMEVQDIDFQHIEADFVFSVDNPNPVDVQLSSFSYDLDLESQDLLSGDNAEGFQLEAVGSSELALPLNLGWQDAWDTVEATRGEDFVAFGLGGHFGFETPVGEARIPYQEDGDFPALRTPKFSVKKLRVAQINALTQEADLELDLGVDNAHGSTLFFDAVDYTVSLSGKQVGDGFLDQLGGVDGATEETVTLPLTVDLVAAGTEVADAIIRKRPIQLGLDATMDVDTPFGILPLNVDESGRVTVE